MFIINNMAELFRKARESTVYMLFNLNAFTMPEHQRQYDWRDVHVQTFCSDVHKLVEIREIEMAEEEAKQAEEVKQVKVVKKGRKKKIKVVETKAKLSQFLGNVDFIDANREETLATTGGMLVFRAVDDGQQRMLTVLLYMLAASRRARVLMTEIEADITQHPLNMNSLYASLTVITTDVYKRYVTTTIVKVVKDGRRREVFENINKIRALDDTNDVLDAIIKDPEYVPPEDALEFIFNAYKIIVNELSRLDATQLCLHVTTLEHGFVVYEKELKSHDEAAIVFEMQNSRGKPVSEFALLRAHFYALASRMIENDRDDVREVITSKWKSIMRCMNKFKMHEEEQERSILETVCSVFYGKLPKEKAGDRRFYDKIKKRLVNTETQKNDIITLLGLIESSTRAWAMIKHPDSLKRNGEENEQQIHGYAEMARLLDCVICCEFKTKQHIFAPILCAMFFKIFNSNYVAFVQLLKRVCIALEKRLFWIYLVRCSGFRYFDVSDAYDRKNKTETMLPLYLEQGHVIYKSDNAIETVKDLCEKFSVLRKDFRNPRNELFINQEAIDHFWQCVITAKDFTIWEGHKHVLTQFMNSHERSKVVRMESVKLEFIMPESKQVALKEWKVSSNEHNANCHRIGNLTLLEPRLHVDIKNSDPGTKTTHYRKSLLCANQLCDNFSNGWNGVQIMERSKEIVQESRETWAYGNNNPKQPIPAAAVVVNQPVPAAAAVVAKQPIPAAVVAKQPVPAAVVAKQPIPAAAGKPVTKRVVDVSPNRQSVARFKVPVNGPMTPKTFVPAPIAQQQHGDVIIHDRNGLPISKRHRSYMDPN